MTEWNTVTLGDVCEMYQPKTITSRDLIEDGEYTVYGANGVIGRYDKYNHAEAELLVTCRGATCGAVNISVPFSWINGNAMVVKPKRNDLDVRFLEYLFKGALDISTAITGAAQPQITRQSLSPLKFSYPPLAIQKAIVAKLDAAFASIDTAIAAAEKNAENAKQLFQSYLSDVFEKGGEGWRFEDLGNICDFQNGFAFKSTLFTETGFPILRISNIQKNAIDTKRIVYTNPNSYKENLTKYIVEKGDLLIAMSGATTGKVGFNTTDTKFLLNQRVGKFMPKKTLSKQYLFYFLSTQVEKNLSISAGAAQPNLSTEQIKSMKLPLPDINKQNSIASDISILSADNEKLEMIYKNKASLLYQLKQSLLQQAFSGQLVDA